VGLKFQFPSLKEGEAMRKNLLPFAAMVLTVGAFALRPAQAATQLVVDFDNVLNPISNGYLALISGTGPDQTFEGFAQLPTIAAGTTPVDIIVSPASQSQTNPTDINDTTPITGIALVGVYTQTSAEATTTGISFGVNVPTAAALESESYSTFTSGIPLAPPESTLVSDLQNPPPGSISEVLSLVGTVLGGYSSVTIPIGGDGTIVDFSNGTFNGDVFLSEGPTSGTTSPGGGTTVPIPTSAMSGLIMLAILGAATIVRRKQTA
jgi:hypothetical protein